MDDLKKIIYQTVSEIAQQQNKELSKISDTLSLTSDIGFSSLDIAQLVATLEIKTGLDPFALEFTISSIRTIEELHGVYLECSKRYKS